MTANRKNFFLKKSNLFCFTPEVALATFFIEILLAGYVLFRYGLSGIGRLSIITLVFLGLFQFAEYMICAGGDPIFWSKFGTVSITLLPVFGFQIVTLLNKTRSNLTALGYSMGFLIIGWITLLGVPIIPECTGKFVTLKFTTLFDLVFNAYYAFFVLAALVLIFKNWSSKGGNKAGQFWMMITYLSFLVPTVLVYIFINVARQAMPSIMCGFAIFGALLLVFKVLPEYSRSLTSKKRHKK